MHRGRTSPGSQPGSLLAALSPLHHSSLVWVWAWVRAAQLVSLPPPLPAEHPGSLALQGRGVTHSNNSRVGLRVSQGHPLHSLASLPPVRRVLLLLAVSPSPRGQGCLHLVLSSPVVSHSRSSMGRLVDSRARPVHHMHSPAGSPSLRPVGFPLPVVSLVASLAPPPQASLRRLPACPASTVGVFDGRGLGYEIAPSLLTTKYLHL